MSIFATPINMLKNEIRNALLHVLASAPSSPAEGQVYYDSTEQEPKFRNASTFQLFRDAIKLAGQLPSYYLSRANHTGTQPASTISDFATASDARITALRGAANGVAPLGADSKVPAAYLPSFVDDVLEFANFAALPATGSGGILYVTIDNGKTFRWSGSAYAEISASPGSTDAVPEGATNLYFTAERAQDEAAGVFTGGTHSGISFSYNDTTGKVNATVTAAGGTKKYSVLVGNGSALSFTFTQATHGCAADRTNSVYVVEEATGLRIFASETVAANGDVTVAFSVAPTANQYRVTIVG